MLQHLIHILAAASFVVSTGFALCLLAGVVACVIADRCGYDNCLFWAIGMYLEKGGFVVMRKSHWGWWPHWAWSADLIHFEAFVPPPTQRMDVRLPYPMFKGRIKYSPEP